MHAFYLHGFASSASSSKARFFAERFAGLGLPLHTPDLNAPDFSTLTTTRMIDQVAAAFGALEPGPVALIGSSLGAFVAWHLAARRPVDGGHPIARLVLIAPAFDFGRVGIPGFGEEELRQWRETGWRTFDHHAENQPREVHIGLYEDAQRYDSQAVDVRVPTLVFQGLRDELVEASRVRAFAAARPTITLCELDGDHQLHDALPIIWEQTAAFLGLNTR